MYNFHFEISILIVSLECRILSNEINNFRDASGEVMISITTKNDFISDLRK